MEDHRLGTRLQHQEQEYQLSLHGGSDGQDQQSTHMERLETQRARAASQLEHNGKIVCIARVGWGGPSESKGLGAVQWQRTPTSR